MQYIYTMGYYSAIKMSEIMPFAATWMQLEIIILSEVSQPDKDKSYITYMWNLKNNDINELIYKTEIENKLMVTKGDSGGWVAEGIN